MSSLPRLADALDEWATKFGRAVLVAGTHFEGVLILGPPGTETDPQAFTSRKETLGAEIIELSERVIPELVSAGEKSLASSLLQAVDQFRRDRAFSRFEALRPQLRVAALSQLVSPATTLPSPTSTPPAGTRQSEGEKPGADRSKGIPLAEAEVRVREWLLKNAKDNPAAITRDAVAAGTGVSGSTVSRTSAWKAFRERRDANAQPKPRGVSLTRAIQSVVPGVGETPDELAALVEEQKADEAEQERRYKMRRNRRSDSF